MQQEQEWISITTKVEMAVFHIDTFYEHEPSEEVYCGYCVASELRKSKDGTYTEEESMKASEFRYLEDQDDEPYQCFLCNKQNDAYEDIEDSE